MSTDSILKRSKDLKPVSNEEFKKIQKRFTPLKITILEKYKSCGVPRDELSQIIDIGLWLGLARCKDKKYEVSSIASMVKWIVINKVKEENKNKNRTVKKYLDNRVVHKGQIVKDPETGESEVVIPSKDDFEDILCLKSVIKTVRENLGFASKEVMDMLYQGCDREVISKKRGVGKASVSHRIVRYIRPQFIEELKNASTM